MRSVIILLVVLSLISCKQESNLIEPNESTMTQNSPDTIITKHKNEHNKSYENERYSYSYYWLVDKDTLDIRINVTEYAKDSSLHLNFLHNKPILFETALNKINECIPIIQEDFMITKLNSFYFRPPIYYKDITNDLSAAYEQKYGEKNIEYQNLNEFLLESKLTFRLEKYLNQINKSVLSYSIEKFHLLKKDSFRSYIPDEDLSNYPDFSIHGMGIFVRIEDQE